MTPDPKMKRSASTAVARMRHGWGVRATLACAAGVLGYAMVGAAFAEVPVACGARLDPDAVLRRINEIRANGRTCNASGPRAIAGPLSWSESLATAALQQSREMALLKRMSHRDSRDRSLAERLSEHGYRYSAAAENVAVGYPSFDEVVEAWLESEGHCENLMSGAVRESGLACIDGSEAGPPEDRRYWTLVLGAPAGGR